MIRIRNSDKLQLKSCLLSLPVSFIENLWRESIFPREVSQCFNQGCEYTQIQIVFLWSDSNLGCFSMVGSGSELFFYGQIRIWAVFRGSDPVFFLDTRIQIRVVYYGRIRIWVVFWGPNPGCFFMVGSSLFFDGRIQEYSKGTASCLYWLKCCRNIIKHWHI